MAPMLLEEQPSRHFIRMIVLKPLPDGLVILWRARRGEFRI